MITGFEFRADLGIYVRPEQAPFGYSDGDETENRIYQLICDTKDVGVGSSELFAKADDWATLYHFSPARANLLRPIKHLLQGDVLELGAGCGAITRYLGETATTVTAVEGSARRAGIAAARCRGLQNVSIYSDNFQRFPEGKKYDVVTMIGVLEYSRMFIDGPDPIQAALQIAKRHLKPSGVLIVAIENQLGLKYFAGAPEDHLGSAFVGIEGRYDAKGPVTFGRKILQAQLLNAGFAQPQFLYPFPDYKLPAIVFTEKGMEQGADFVENLLCGQSARNQHYDYKRLFVESAAWREVAANGMAAELANSFLVIASEGAPEVAQDNLAFAYSAERQREFAREIRIVQCGAEKSVLRSSLFSDARLEQSGAATSSEAYLDGRIYFNQLPLILGQPGWQITHIAQWATVWIDWLKQYELSQGQEKTVVLPGRFIDAAPFNLMMAADGQLTGFDFEWDEQESTSLEYVVFRGLLHCLLRAGVVAVPEAGVSLNIVDLIVRVMQCCDMDVAPRLSALLVDEYELHTRIAQRAARPSQMMAFELPTKLDPVAAPHEFARGKALEEHANALQEHAKSLETHNLALKSQIHTLNDQLKELGQELTQALSIAGQREGQINILGAEINALRSELGAVYQSKSWRATANLRNVMSVVVVWRARWGKLRRLRTASGGWGKLGARASRAVLKGGPVQTLNRFRNLERPQPEPFSQPVVNQDAPIDYPTWIARFDTRDAATRKRMQGEIASLEKPPQISVVMPTYNTPEHLLGAVIDSVRNQIYPHWQLCIADDASTAPHVRNILQRYAAQDSRIKVTFREVNGHIVEASNSALALATGEFMVLLDHDDELADHALYEVAKAIVANPQAKLFYSDEDKLSPEGLRIDPYFKPDWNPDLFLSQNMFSHLGVYELGMVRQVGGFRVGMQGSQDYDLALRCIEVAGHSAVVHIPQILYHWRIVPGSTAASGTEKPYALSAAIRAVEEHLDRSRVSAAVDEAMPGMGMLRVKYALPTRPPKVSIIIPTRDAVELVKQCIESVLEKTTYPNYEIILVDNGSTDPNALAYFALLQQKGHVRILRDDSPFNYSRLNNCAVAEAAGEIICLLNNDIEVISPDWLSEMVSQAVRPEIGAVGARLWYPNDTLQHAGVVLGFGGVAGHLHHGLTRQNPGYFGRAWLVQNVSAVTAACLVVRKEVFDKVKGLNEEDLVVAFNDVDLCIRIRDAGYRNLWTPFAELYHYESATRGTDIAPAKRKRFEKEVEYMNKKYGDALQRDPAYSLWLDLNAISFAISSQPRPVTN